MHVFMSMSLFEQIIVTVSTLFSTPMFLMIGRRRQLQTYQHKNIQCGRAVYFSRDEMTGGLSEVGYDNIIL